MDDEETSGKPFFPFSNFNVISVNEAETIWKIADETFSDVHLYIHVSILAFYSLCTKIEKKNRKKGKPMLLRQN